MSDLQYRTVTLTTIERDIQIPKRTGGSYPGTRLGYRGFNGEPKDQCFHSKSLEINQALAADVAGLTAGMEVTFVYAKNEKGFNDFKAIKQGRVAATEGGITPVAAASTGYSRPASNDYTTGAIKGNTVTNAIHLATALYGKPTQAQLSAAADMVLELHAYVESTDVLSVIANYKAAITTAEVAPAKAKAKAKVDYNDEAF